MGTDRSITDQTRELISRIHRLTARWTAPFKSREIAGLLADLAATGQHAAAPYVLHLCYHSNRTIASAAASTARRLLEGIPPLEIAYLDQVLRELSPYSVCNVRVPSLRRGELSRYRFARVDAPFVFGLTSCHPDGYIREEALRTLTTVRTGTELPFVLVRMNDWVEQIRVVAHAALSERLTPEYARHFVMNLPLVHRLQECGRDRHEDTVGAIEQLLSAPESVAALRTGCRSDEQSVRRACYLLAVENPLLELCQEGLKESDPLVRLHCARLLLRERSARDLTTLLDQLVVDRFVPIRREALRTYVERLPEEADERLRAGLADENIAVREFAAYYLKKRTEIDIQAFYREQLNIARGRRLAAMILGLGEHGQVEDVARLLGFYLEGSPRIKRAVLRAVSRLDKRNHTEFFTEALLSELPGVSREARDILKREAAHVDSAILEQALLGSPLVHVRRNVFHVLAERGKYDSLYHALVAVRDQSQSVRDAALRFVSRWLCNYNQSYIQPTSAQVDRLQKALRESESGLPESVVSQLRFLVSSP